MVRGRDFFVQYFINPRVFPVLILFYGSGFVTSPASRWTGRCFDKVLCLVNVDEVSIVLGCLNPIIFLPIMYYSCLAGGVNA